MWDALAQKVFGRDVELAFLESWVSSPDPLMTLVGAPGIGKSRLARELKAVVARTGLPVFWIDVAGAVQAVELLRAAAQSLGISFDASASATSESQLLERLRALGPVLLIIDCFEGLEKAAATIVSRWAEGAPRLRVLVTSRERLKVLNERLLVLGPLDPDSAGVALLTARVQALRPDFDFHGPEGARLAELVRRLEGVPLAIECISGHVALLGAAEVLRRLATSVMGFVNDLRDAPERHASLRAAVGYSWAQTSEHARQVLRAAAIFRSGFELDELMEILDQPREAVVNALAGLVDGSLVRRLSGGPLSGGFRASFRLFDFIRAFVVEQDFDPAEIATLERRHGLIVLSRYEALAERIEREPSAIVALEQGFDELMLVFERGVAATDAPTAAAALRAGLLLDTLLSMRGPVELRAYVLRGALDPAQRAGVADELIERALRASAWQRGNAGDTNGAEHDLDEADRLASGHSRDPEGAAARIALDRGWLAYECGQHLRAIDELSRAAAVFSARSQHRDVARAELLLAKVKENAGQRRGSELHFFRALSALRDAKARRSQAYVLFLLCDVLRQLRREDWRAFADSGRHIAEEFGDRDVLARMKMTLATAEVDAGRSTEALRLAKQALAELLPVTGDRIVALGHFVTGLCAMDDGRALEAAEHFRAAMLRYRAMGAARWVATSSAQLCGALAVLGDLEGATAALQAARQRQAEGLDELLGPLLLLQGARLEVARGRREHEAGDLPVAFDRFDRAARALQNVEVLAAQGVSEDARFATRWLERELRAATPQHAQAPSPSQSGSRAPAEDRPTWWVAADGSAFRAPDGQVVSLKRRLPLRRILLALARQRVHVPGEHLTHEQLIASGWPGERLSRGAAINRLNVAMVHLRQLGVRPVLETEPGGYRLSPGVALLVVDTRVLEQQDRDEVSAAVPQG